MLPSWCLSAQYERHRERQKDGTATTVWRPAFTLRVYLTGNLRQTSGKFCL